jgi:hypothetical protein
MITKISGRPARKPEKAAGRKRRQLSPETRQRISQAETLRWAKVKSVTG